MPVVICLISLREGRGALVDGTILCGHEVVASRIVIGEVNGETTRIDEGHSTGLRFVKGSSIDILLVRISLTLQLLQVCVLKALFHRPFYDTAIARDRDEGLGLVFFLHPLDFPDNVRVLIRDILR